MINNYYICEFVDSNGVSEHRMLAATTSLGAEKRAFEVGLNNGLTPKYETIRVATKKEVSDLKKKIRNRIKK